MKNFWQVTYVGDSIASPSVYYKVKFEKLDETGDILRSFMLTPNILINDKMGNSPNPSTHRSIVRDLYTHITMAPLKRMAPCLIRSLPRKARIVWEIPYLLPAVLLYLKV